MIFGKMIAEHMESVLIVCSQNMLCFLHSDKLKLLHAQKYGLTNVEKSAFLDDARFS